MIGPAGRMWGMDVVPGVVLFEFLVVGAISWSFDCKRQTNKNSVQNIKDKQG